LKDGSTPSRYPREACESMLSQKLAGAAIPPDGQYWSGIGSKKMGNNFNLQTHIVQSQELGRSAVEHDKKYRESLYKALTATYQMLEQYKGKKRNDLATDIQKIGYTISFKVTSSTTIERIAVDIVFPGLDAKIASTYANALIAAKEDGQTSSTLMDYLAKNTITALARGTSKSKTQVSKVENRDRSKVFKEVKSQGSLKNVRLPGIVMEYAVLLVRKEKSGDVSVILATENEEAVNAIANLYQRKKAGLNELSLSFPEEQQLPEPMGTEFVLKRKDLQQAA
jgi:hypothetical protein